MEKFDLFDLIEAYLDGALPEEKRLEVERRMAEDETFRREVELQRELQENFSDPGRLRLRSALAKVMEEPLPSVETTPYPVGHRVVPMNWKKRLISIAAVLLVGIGIWYLLQVFGEQPIQNTVDKQHTEKPSAPIAKGNDSIPVQPTEEPTPPKQKPKENSYIAEADPANFAHNASMEALVSSGVRSENMDIKISSPSNGADFVPNINGEVNVRFAGTVKGISENELGALVLAIFNNKDAVKPLVSVPLGLKQDANGNMSFEVQQRLKFQLGLYYYTIEQEGEMVYTGKFTIGKLKK